MATDLTPSDRAAVERIVERLEAAWNAMDGPAFAAAFAAEADFVNIRGEHHRGQAAIAAGHAAIFRNHLTPGARTATPSRPPDCCVHRLPWFTCTPCCTRLRARSRGGTRLDSRWCSPRSPRDGRSPRCITRWRRHPSRRADGRPASRSWLAFAPNATRRPRSDTARCQWSRMHAHDTPCTAEHARG